MISRRHCPGLIQEPQAPTHLDTKAVIVAKATRRASAEHLERGEVPAVIRPTGEAAKLLGEQGLGGGWAYGRPDLFGLP